METLDLLKSVAVFARLSQEDLRKLAGLVEEKQVPSGTMLFRQGDPGDALYVVVSGRLRSFSADAMGKESLVEFTSPGQSLGEMSLLLGEPRPVSVQAVTDARLLVLRKIAFDVFLAGNIQAMLEMMKALTDRQPSAPPVPIREQGEAPGPVPTYSVDRPASADLPPTPIYPREASVAPVQPPAPSIVYIQPPAGRVITVFSPKGGVGKSTLAVNLAVSLARMHPDAVALVDLSLTFGHDMLLLNLAAKSSLATTNAAAISKMNLDNGLDFYMVTHPSSGLRVMCGSRRPEEGEMVTGETAKAAIEQLKRFFQFVVVDTSSQFNDSVLAALEEADKVLVLCSPEISTLRDVRESQRILSNVVRISSDKIHYLMNQLFPFKALSREQFEGALQQEIFAELPYGSDGPTKAALKGEALVDSQRGSAMAKAIERLAVQFAAERAKVGAGYDSNNDKKRGFFR